MDSSDSKVKNIEDQSIKLLQKLYTQSQDKRKFARIITFIVLGIAVIQELFMKSGLSYSWREITIYMLMGYFGAATIRSTFKFNPNK